MSNGFSNSELSYLRDDELISGIEMLFDTYRDFTSDPDEILKAYGFGRAHHRVVHFLGCRPGMTITELLTVLNVTKQRLGRVLSQLIREGFAKQRKGHRDRRLRLLSFTHNGKTLFAELSCLQKERVARAYQQAGAEAVAGFQKVPANLLNSGQRQAVLKPVKRS